MIAVDTNVVIRFLLNDDREQGARARKLFASNEVFLSKTVLLESEWVLRSLYRTEAAEIHRAFIRLLGIPGVFVENSPQVALALDRFGLGIDFADALHVASGSEADGFATFDRKLAKYAGNLFPLPVRIP